MASMRLLRALACSSATVRIVRPFPPVALVYYLDSRAVDLLFKSIAAASVRCPCTAFLGTIMNRGAGLRFALEHLTAVAQSGGQVLLQPTEALRHVRHCATGAPLRNCLPHLFRSAAMADLIQESVGQAAVAASINSMDATASWEVEGEALASATTDPETGSIDMAGEGREELGRLLW